MAEEKHIARLKKGVDAWNAWRKRKGARKPDLYGADLSHTDLHGVNLGGANLRAANLSGADLRGADLRDADLLSAKLTRANLSGANLSGADLGHANLSEADLSRADLLSTTLNGANLSNANLAKVRLAETVFTALNLTRVIGLETCEHLAPSAIDHRTLQQSSPLPIPFLRGIGLPERLIEYLPSIFNQALQYYSCFISYSSRDQGFADRIHADLQNKGVRCWFAPHDMPIGGKILDEIDVAIQLRDRLLLILSEHSIKSDWVEDEVTKAFEEERNRGQTVLFPIRLDDAVMDTDEAWAAKLRAQRNIGDFRNWKDHSVYKDSFQRVMRDLAPKSG